MKTFLLIGDLDISLSMFILQEIFLGEVSDTHQKMSVKVEIVIGCVICSDYYNLMHPVMKILMVLHRVGFLMMGVPKIVTPLGI